MKKKRTVTKGPPESAASQPAAEKAAPRAQKRMVTQSDRAEVEALLEQRELSKQAEAERAEVGK